MLPFYKNTGRRQAEFMLLLATFFWGWTFPVVKETVAVMPVFAFLTCRFALAAVLMLVFNGCRLPSLQAWRQGTLLGLVLFLVFALQTWGLVFTSSANSAFITGLNVVWVFVLQPGSWRRLWPQALLAVAGLWFLTAPTAVINIGDVLTLGCSLFVAIHILMLARVKPAQSSRDLVLLQFVAVAAAAGTLSAVTEPSLLTVEWSGEIVFALLLTAGAATVFAFWVQTHFQRYSTPMRTGLILVCEPLFAALFAVGFYGEMLAAGAWLGAVLIFVAMVWAVWRMEL